MTTFESQVYATIIGCAIFHYLKGFVSYWLDIIFDKKEK